MFLGVLNTVFLNISNYLPHLEPGNRSIQIVVITNFVVISNVGIKRFDCTMVFDLSMPQASEKTLCFRSTSVCLNILTYVTCLLIGDHGISYCAVWFLDLVLKSYPKLIVVDTKIPGRGYVYPARIRLSD